jgi:hypothetical protein
VDFGKRSAIIVESGNAGGGTPYRDEAPVIGTGAAKIRLIVEGTSAQVRILYPDFLNPFSGFPPHDSGHLLTSAAW